jgi:hypothetical protein
MHLVASLTVSNIYDKTRYPTPGGQPLAVKLSHILKNIVP